MRMERDFNLEMRTVHSLVVYEIVTVEDLLRFIKGKGLNALLKINKFGAKSLKDVKKALLKHYILDENG